MAGAAEATSEMFILLGGSGIDALQHFTASCRIVCLPVSSSPRRSCAAQAAAWIAERWIMRSVASQDLDSITALGTIILAKESNLQLAEHRKSKQSDIRLE